MLKRGTFFIVVGFLMINLITNGRMMQAQPMSPDTLAPALAPEDQLPDSSGYAFLSEALFPDSLEQAASPEETRAMIQEMVLMAYHEKIERLMMAGLYKEALAVSDSTLELAETPQNYYYQGLVNEALTNWRQAEWAYSKAIRIDPGYIECYQPLIQVVLNLNRPAEAVTWCDRLFEVDPAQTEALLLRSRAFAMENEYYEAIEDVSLAIMLDSLWAEAYRLRALYYMETRQYQAAVDDWSQLIAWDAGQPECYLWRADCFDRLQESDLALQDYRRAAELSAAQPQWAGLYREAEAAVQLLTPPVEQPAMDTLLLTPPVVQLAPGDSLQLAPNAVSSSPDTLIRIADRDSIAGKNNFQEDLVN